MKKIEENNLLVAGQLMLEDMAVLEVHSKSNKAFDFLQGQVTSDISSLNKDNTYQLSCTCNQKGQVVADFIINRSGDDYKIIIKNELIELFINDLEPYAKFFSVNFLKNDFPSVAKDASVTFLENKDSFSDKEWKNLYKLSENTFVEETESLKQGAAGAGLTDNDEIYTAGYYYYLNHFILGKNYKFC